MDIYGLVQILNLCFFPGTLTNIKNLIISSGQKLSLSSQTKTSTFSNNVRTYMSPPGEYSFTLFTIKDNAEVTLEETGRQINFHTLEQHYGSKLFGKNLDIATTYFILHPGSMLYMTGAGFPAEDGPGKGKVVCKVIDKLCCSLYSPALKKSEICRG